MNYFVESIFIFIGVLFFIFQPFVRKEITGSGDPQGGYTPKEGEVIELYY